MSNRAVGDQTLAPAGEPHRKLQPIRSNATEPSGEHDYANRCMRGKVPGDAGDEHARRKAGEMMSGSGHPVTRETPASKPERDSAIPASSFYPCAVLAGKDRGLFTRVGLAPLPLRAL